MDIRPYGPGKFNTLIDSLVWTLLQTNGSDEELAEPGFGWRAVVRLEEGEAPLNLQVQEANPQQMLNVAENEFLSAQVGFIATEGDDGGVDIDYFDAPEELDAAWQAARDDYATYVGEDEMENPQVTSKHAAAQHIRKISGSEIERTMVKAVATLAQGGIASLVVGGYAVQEHGYPRFTHDVDLVVEDVAKAHEYLSIRGFKANPGSSMTLTDRETKAEVDLLPAGGHLDPGPLALPHPGPVNSKPTIIELPALLAIKLSTFMGRPNARLKDAADVVELMKANDLPLDYALPAEVREAYEKLWHGLHQEGDYSNQK